MEGEGHINTSFLTTKLPTWAGVRQNVTGSDLNGRPVPAFIPPAEVRAAEDCGILDHSQGSMSPPAAIGITDSSVTRTETPDGLDRLYATLKSTLDGIKVQLCELMKSMKRFEDRLEVVEEELEAAADMEAEEGEEDEEEEAEEA